VSSGVDAGAAGSSGTVGSIGVCAAQFAGETGTGSGLLRAPRSR
jgi:hypothetical protein